MSHREELLGSAPPKSPLLVSDNKDEPQLDTLSEVAGSSYIPFKELDSKASHLIKKELNNLVRVARLQITTVKFFSTRSQDLQVLKSQKESRSFFSI